MTREERNQLLKERSSLQSDINAIARVSRFMTKEQLAPYEVKAKRIVEIERLINEDIKLNKVVRR